MTAGLRALTAGMLLLPAILLAAAGATTGPERAVLVVVSGLVVATYAAVWLVGRPTAFEVDDAALRVVWPLRSRTVPRASIAGARMVTAADFRAEHGTGIRIGAGGLWGGFGLLRTRRATFSMWISRTDRLVIVALRGARPLLVTPEAPERFVAALGA